MTEFMQSLQANNNGSFAERIPIIGPALHSSIDYYEEASIRLTIFGDGGCVPAKGGGCFTAV